jgi:quinol monooxygenase YgiN
MASLRMVIPEPRREEVLRTLRVVMGHATAKTGCLGYHVCQDVDDCTALTVIERWATQEDLDDHLRSSEYRTFLAVIDLASEPPTISFDIVERSGGLEVVEAARAPRRRRAP